VSFAKNPSTLSFTIGVSARVRAKNPLPAGGEGQGEGQKLLVSGVAATLSARGGGEDPNPLR